MNKGTENMLSKKVKSKIYSTALGFVVILFVAFFVLYFSVRFISLGPSGEIFARFATSMSLKHQALPITALLYPYFDAKDNLGQNTYSGYGLISDIKLSSENERVTIEISKGIGGKTEALSTKRIFLYTPTLYSGYFLYRSRYIPPESGENMVVGGFKFVKFSADVSLISKNDYIKYVYTKTSGNEKNLQEIYWLGSNRGLLY